MITDIYKDPRLKYPLTFDELNARDEIWKFFSYFQISYAYVSEYRKDIISTLRKEYTPELFFYYENALNKMFWNLRWLLFPLWENKDISVTDYWAYVNASYGKRDEIPQYLLLCKSETYVTKADLKQKIRASLIKEKTYYRSYVNKVFTIDDEKKKLITKPIEGSLDIFAKNFFNLQTSTIMMNRSLYEAVILNPFYVITHKIPLPEFYYQLDYALPNLNYCVYDNGSNATKKNRIYKMYYTKKENPEKNWFKLIKFDQA